MKLFQDFLNMTKNNIIAIYNLYTRLRRLHHHNKEDPEQQSNHHARATLSILISDALRANCIKVWKSWMSVACRFVVVETVEEFLVLNLIMCFFGAEINNRLIQIFHSITLQSEMTCLNHNEQARENNSCENHLHHMLRI